MLRAILNRSWQQHPTRRQLYSHLPPITKTIQARRTRHAGHCWRSKDEIVSDALLRTPAYGQAKAGRPSYVMIRDVTLKTCRRRWMIGRRGEERVRDIRASRTTWWWWLPNPMGSCKSWQDRANEILWPNRRTTATNKSYILFKS